MGVLTIEEMKKKIEYKHVLLDANALIEAHHSSVKFTDLIQFLLDAHCQPVIMPFVEFEIFRNCFQPEFREALERYLAVWHCFSLPLGDTGKLLQESLTIAQYCAARKLATPSLTDCFIGALLKRHKNELYLLTRNHKDFPPPLFVRELTWSVDMPRDVVTFGFYRFDESQLI